MKKNKSLYVFFFGTILFYLNMSFKNYDHKTTSVYVYDDYAAVNLNKEEKINIIANDYGFSDGISSLKIVVQPTNGTLTINSDYSVNYIPDTNYVGEDIFKYEICNTSGQCGIGKVDIDVLYKDYIPFAINDTITSYWSKEKIFNCCDNDSNLLNLPIQLNIEIPAQKGECNLYNDTSILYFPGKGYSGRDSIQYSVTDEDGDISYAWILINLLDNGSTDKIFIPNGFSPNGDAINDYFQVPDFENASEVKLTIFTQWGDIVYQNTDYKNNWDGIANKGSNKGSKVKVGTYYYRFIVKDLQLDQTGYVYINY